MTLLAMGISQNKLVMICDDIANTTRPCWHATPLANFGQVSHGKLKANEWRLCFKFNIPMSLLWIGTWGNASQTDEYRPKLVHSTLVLAIAIHWATSHHVSAKHIKQYKKNMKDYLKMLKELRPLQCFHPNHINALLISKYLRLYGPVRGW